MTGWQWVRLWLALLGIAFLPTLLGHLPLFGGAVVGLAIGMCIYTIMNAIERATGDQS